MLLLNGLYAAINTLIFIRDNFLSGTWKAASLLDIFHKLHWWGWALILLVSNLLLLIEGTVRAVRKREGQTNSIAHELQAIKNARPKIGLKEPNAIILKMVTQTILEIDQPLRTSPFLCLRFVNDPPVPTASAIARGISAKIRYYLHGKDIPCLELDGRWADTDEASIRDVRQSRTDLLRIDFNIGDEHEVDIAFIVRETDTTYAWNNDNYRHFDLIRPEHKLPDDVIDVQVRLRGLNVDQTFAFSFVTLHQNFEVVAQPHAVIVMPEDHGAQ